MDATQSRLVRACDMLAEIVSNQLQGAPDDEATLEKALALANDALTAAREPHRGEVRARALKILDNNGVGPCDCGPEWTGRGRHGPDCTGELRVSLADDIEQAISVACCGQWEKEIIASSFTDSLNEGADHS